MIDNREDSLLEIKARIAANRGDLEIASFKRTPTSPISDEDMPCIVMLEGDDKITDFSKRSNAGYPVRRALEVTLELITTKETDIKAKLKDLRRIVFTQRDTDPPIFNSRLVPEGRIGFIQESGTLGPTGYGLPGILGMNLVLDLVYTDDVL